jgi:membrane protein implicated in regulation of membrane protease activity
VIWIATAVALLAWLAGVALRIGSWVHLLLLAAAVMLAYLVVQERSSERSRDP